MKKRAWILAGIVLLIVLFFATQNLGTRKITVISGKEFVHQCPRSARPGEEVIIETSVISDGEIYVNGVDGEYIQPGVYVFVMPDADVEIKVTVIAFPDGA